MKHYNHLTEKDRIFLRIMLDKKYSKNKSAHILRVDRSTIYRDIKRNSCDHFYSKKTFYWSNSAHEKYLNQRKRETTLEKDRPLKCLDYKTPQEVFMKYAITIYD